ncbi:hypothetical protein EDB84DRAFT_1521006 [Lactarius hengduanensis]|nr:hypothetical protein EDB84DRAFT_1521006 [Lactarius hengduanensis]
MSLPTIQNAVVFNLCPSCILILKHATFLRLSSMSPQSALTRRLTIGRQILTRGFNNTLLHLLTNTLTSYLWTLLWLLI